MRITIYNMKKEKKLNNKLVVYQAKNGAIEIRTDSDKETVWATQADIVRLFEKDQSVISRHISNIFKDGEIDQKSNMQKMHNANSDKPVIYYSLDVILSVGYRTNSGKAIEFRKWATKILRNFINKGYVINPVQIKNNYAKFLETVEDIKSLLPVDKNIDSKSILELVKTFADTWLSLDAYDKDELKIKTITKRKVKLTADELTKAISDFKVELIKKQEATDLFAMERQKDSLAGIVGNVMQGFGGQDVYSGLEEKAAHLLYFLVKNHPFVDGNKRSGAYAFVWFLKRVNLLNMRQITPAALTAITLLIAESKPREKDKMVALVVRMLN